MVQFHKRHFLFFILAAFAVFSGVFWLFFPVLSPFLFGLIFAYLLRPSVLWLSDRGVSPLWTAWGVMIGSYLFLLLLGIQIMPSLENLYFFLIREFHPERLSLFFSSSVWFKDVREVFAHFQPLADNAGNAFASSYSHILAELGRYFVLQGLSLAHFTVNTAIVPLVTFHFIKDWASIQKGFFFLIPVSLKMEAHLFFQQLHRCVFLYLRGQGITCLILGAYYGTTMMVFSGFKHGGLMGILTGFFSFIPYVSFFASFVISTVLSISIHGTWGHMACIGCIYLGGYLLESTLLTPFIIGKKVGLHPLIVLMAVLLGGYVGHFTGVLLAIPMATILGVFWQYARYIYVESVCTDQVKNTPLE